jgi:ABC-2 type transport system ATP-binding protein
LLLINKLVSEINEQVIEVEFDKSVNETLFSGLTDLKSCKNLQGNSWELTFETEVDMRSAIFDFAHDNGLKTLQLNLKSKNLEEIFREKTTKK